MPAKKSKTPKHMLSITLVKSPIGYSVEHKKTVRALGLHRMHQTVIHEDSSSLQGMLRMVNHLVKVEEQVEK